VLLRRHKNVGRVVCLWTP